MDLRTGKVRDLAPSLSQGIFGRFDVSFDATKVVFDWKKDVDTGFYIYEVDIDGKEVALPKRVTTALEKAWEYSSRNSYQILLANR